MRLVLLVTAVAATRVAVTLAATAAASRLGHRLLLQLGLLLEKGGQRAVHAEELLLRLLDLKLERVQLSLELLMQITEHITLLKER